MFKKMSWIWKSLKVIQGTELGGMILADAKTNIVDLVELQFIENALSARFSEMEKLKDSPELNEA